MVESDLARIPVGNLRVSRAEFGAVWAFAERLCDEQEGLTDWYAAGVAVTCEWLATAVVRASTGRTYPARSPVTRRTARAYEELIEAEFVAAEKTTVDDPRLADQPGWTEAICATLRWAWRCSGPPPLEVASGDHWPASSSTGS